VVIPRPLFSFRERFRHGGVLGHAGQSLACVALVFDAQKFFGQAAGRVQGGEIIVTKSRAPAARRRRVAYGHGNRLCSLWAPNLASKPFAHADVQDYVLASPALNPFYLSGHQRHLQALQRFQ